MNGSSIARAVFHYAILIGLPFVGVLKVMEAGKQITPPPSIQGTWALDADFESNRDTACAERLSGFGEPSITISQSGVFLEVHLPNPRRDVLAGRLNDGGFVAEAPPALFGDDVFGLLRVTGAIVSNGEERLMRGIIAMPRRVDCDPVPYVARKSAETK